MICPKIKRKIPCPSTQHYANDPQDDQGEPEENPCGFCGQITPAEEFCSVPSTKYDYRTKSNIPIVLYCCKDCYEQVCDEEGHNPQGEIS